MSNSNPHDKFVRRIFAGKEESIAFFEKTLPADIVSKLDISKLEHTKETFVSKKHVEHRTDMLYKIPIKSGEEIYIYLLFEHKSYLDPDIFTQLLGYLSKIYEWQERNNVGELNIVVPFVFYHGKEIWNIGNKFSERFNISDSIKDLLAYIPDFPLKIFQLREYSEELNTRNLALNLQLRIIQKIRSNPNEFQEKLRRSVIELSHLSEEHKRVAILASLLEYIVSARDDGKNYKRREFYKELEGEYMLISEEERQEAMIEGKLEGKLEDARVMQIKGYPFSDILEITGLSEKELLAHGIGLNR